MKVVITGGAGYIGSVLVDTLLKGPKYNDDGELQEGWFDDIYEDELEVVVIDNLLYKQNSLLPYFGDQRFRFVKADAYEWSKEVENHLKSADVIIPLACIVGAPACDKLSEKEVTQINYGQILKITKLLKPHQKLIYPTTNSGYGIGQDGVHCTEETPLNPISLYGKTKVFAEADVLGAKGVSLRLATVFGLSPRMRLDLLVNDFTYKALRDKYIVLFESHFKRNYIHIRDVAEAFIFVYNNYDKMKGQAYNVGLSSANLSKIELCGKIKNYIPNFHVVQSEIGKDPDQRNYIVSNQKLEKLGWKPKYSLDDGIQEIIKAYPMLENNQYTKL